MAEAMSRRSDITLLPPAQIVPIPLHPSRERERGFNQAALLGQGLAQALNLPFTDTLQRIRKTRSQATLSERERGPNIQGAFGAKKGLVFSKKNVILVDDVSTTGATLEAAARVCQQHGAERVFGVVFARSSR
jgi:ComF family protein